MYIEELKDVDDDGSEELVQIVVSDTKRALVGAGARVLFYPTLFYNLVRNMIQPEFRWWDAVDQFLLLGAVPFPTDVPRLKQLGVCGVVTLNEPYETLVPTSLYHAHGIEHLVLPTRDYLFAPSYGDICEAVDFINKNTSIGKKTYVHCKAGRGRSTTIVLCYLVQHKQMTPKVAYEYVRSIRSRVLLAPAQWKAVQHFYSLRVKSTWNAIGSSAETPKQLEDPHDSENTNDRSAMVLMRLNPSYFTMKNFGISMRRELAAFDENSVVVITESDLVGYNDCDVGNEICAAEVSIVYKVQFASQAALARLSGFRLPCIVPQKVSGEKLGSKSSCGAGADKMGGVGVDIHVY